MFIKIRASGIGCHIMVLTRLAMANQSSHQNFCFLDVYRDQIRRITAKIDDMIMRIQNAVTPGPRDGYGDAPMTASEISGSDGEEKWSEEGENP